MQNKGDEYKEYKYDPVSCEKHILGDGQYNKAYLSLCAPKNAKMGLSNSLEQYPNEIFFFTVEPKSDT